MNESPSPNPTSPPSFPSAAVPAISPVPEGQLDQAFVDAGELIGKIRDQVRRVFHGQDEVIDQVLASFLAGGHVLLEGKPGLGKTHLVLALARTFGGDFSRIQFTPDLMPSDVTGHSLFDMASQTFRLRKGPVFANLLLADEINRAPAKTQSALLEVMQEQQVTIDGESLALPPPFMTLATQNPIEHEGTYPLPEAQLDRFIMKIIIDYPGLSDERDVVVRAASGAGGRGIDPRSVDVVCDPATMIQAQEICAAVMAVDEVVDYAVRLVRATREARGIALGAGTRGAISLVRVGRAYALMAGRNFITPDDVKRAVAPVLRHRVALAPELAISGHHIDEILASVVQTVDAPRR